MKVKEMIRRYPVCAPTFYVGRFGVWFLDERWRLPYRRFEWKRGDGGVSIMAFGLCVMVINGTRQ